MKRLITIIIASICSGCIGFATILEGEINAEAVGKIPTSGTFVLFAEAGTTISERRIQDLITIEMEKRGFQQSQGSQEPDLAVAYTFGIGEGMQVLFSSPDFVFGGQHSSSSTKHARYLSISVLDYKGSIETNEPVLLWQGELLSSGRSQNMAHLAEYFVPELLKFIGQSAINEDFSRALK